jgi:hypothetical protein
MILCFAFLFGHKMCKSTNEALETRIDEFVRLNYVTHDLAKEAGFEKNDHLSYPEVFCQNEDTLMG